MAATVACHGCGRQVVVFDAWSWIYNRVTERIRCLKPHPAKKLWPECCGRSGTAYIEHDCQGARNFMGLAS